MTSVRRRRKSPIRGGARAAALLSLMDVQTGRFPEDALDDHGAGLDRRDRALASALVNGVLRRLTRLEWTLRHFLKKPDKPLELIVQTILNLGLFQLLHLDRVPASAAVNESVNLAKAHGPPWSPKVVNGVLRAVTRAERLPDPASAGLPEIERLAIEWSHPLWLVQRWADELGLEETGALLAANNKIPPLTLRVNTARISREEAAALLSGSAERVEPAAFAPGGLLLHNPKGPAPGLPGFTDGLFAVQDEAAQLIGLLARPQPDEMVLDACAGRGGKALSLAAIAEKPVWGLDPDQTRLLQARLEARRLGLDNLRLVQGELVKGPPFGPGSFEIVLVDAPCSNLGVIRRRPDVRWLKSASDPARLAQFQTGLLSAAARLVKPGGRLVYAVCTLTPEETSSVTTAFCQGHPDFSLEPAAKYLPASARSLIGPEGALRTWPHKHGADGFYAAVLAKNRD